MRDMAIVVKQAENPSDIKTFVELPYRAYRGEPFWRAPLRLERTEHLDPKKNSTLANLQPSRPDVAHSRFQVTTDAPQLLPHVCTLRPGLAS